MDDTMAYTSSSIGAYFSTGSLSVSHYSPIPVVPQIQNAANNYFDQITWKKVKGSFYSSGGESYLTIGNFNSTANTNSMIVNTNTMVYNPCCAFVYIDDVCVTTDSLYSETWTSIETQELNKSKFIKLSPNPASNKLFIQRGNYINNLNITIYDLNMKLLLEVVNFKQNELDISSLPLGVYIIKIWNKDFLDKKLIIKSQ
ncbi:MAG: T9SS type A sorting domain-containing protein [Sphingobacteriaceae bacterium]|nr:T9SS type A sorting domain-containing protein [Sphingobacteriaceae bacterium]